MARSKRTGSGGRSGGARTPGQPNGGGRSDRRGGQRSRDDGPRSEQGSGLRAEITATLAAAGLAPNHRLGQNFMIDPQAVACLVSEADPGSVDRVVEVGPGTGVLTRRLLGHGTPVTAVELDRGLAGVLENELVPRGLELHHGDALVGKSQLHPAIEAAAQGRWVLAANLPYDVSIPVILNCLALPTPPVRLVVTVQLEAAERLCAESGTKAWGASAATAQAAGSGRIVRRLGPRSFHPAPRVRSAILRWDPHQVVPAGFPRWCRDLFAYRRKHVTRALRDAGASTEAASAAVATAGIEGTARFETLTVADLLRLHAATTDLEAM